MLLNSPKNSSDRGVADGAGATLIMQFHATLKRHKSPLFLSNTNPVLCHAKNRARYAFFPLILLAAAQNASPQFSRIARLAAPEQIAPIDRPDFSIKIPRPEAPARGDYLVISDYQESDGAVRHLRGHVTIELYNSTIKADFIDYDEDTTVFTARGNVSYRNYDQNEVVYCDSLEYDTTAEKGTFHHVRG